MSLLCGRGLAFAAAALTLGSGLGCCSGRGVGGLGWGTATGSDCAGSVVGALGCEAACGSLGSAGVPGRGGAPGGGQDSANAALMESASAAASAGLVGGLSQRTKPPSGLTLS